MAWTYILKCSDGSYYTGSTIHLERRLAEHRLGLGANFTQNHLPIELVFAEFCDSVETAFMREKQVQGWSRAKKEALMAKNWDALPPLSRNRENRARETL